MSEKSPHNEVHTGPIKTPKQLLLASSYAFVVPVLIIIGLAYAVTSSYKPQAGSSDLEASTEARIAKVGVVEIRDANRPLVEGKVVYDAQCATCHAAGVAGAPKFGDRSVWASRISQGFDALVHSALAGKGAMAPQRGGEFRDAEIARAVAYMANEAGASFAPPDQLSSSGAAPAESASGSAK